MRRGDVPLLALGLALPSLALVARLPSHPLIIGVLNNFAHAPVFGAFAVVVLVLLRRHTSLPALAVYFVAFLLALAAGGAVELVQPLLGRAAELRDLRNDALGALAGLALHGAIVDGSARRRVPTVAVAIAAAMPAVWPVAEASQAYLVRLLRFPVIVQGLASGEQYFIQVQGAAVVPEVLPAAWARPEDPESLHIRIASGSWPGIHHLEPQPDWSGYSLLKLDLTNPDDRPLNLTLRVHDRAHDNRASDRFNRSFDLKPRIRAVLSIPLREIAEAPIGRTLDLSRVAGLILFTSGDPLEIGREYYVTRIWLE